MSSSRLKAILCLNLFGFMLFFSWYIPKNHGIWFTLDTAIFYYFNQQLIAGSWFVKIAALTNNRAFDIVSFLAMGLLYLRFFVQQERAGKKNMLIIGLVMLLTALVLNQLAHLIPVVRPSPTLTFEHVNHLSHLTEIHTKDASSDSFPSDHGLMLMIYAAFMLRYFSRTMFAIGVLFVIIFTLPRIVAGAHWFTDIYVGAFSVVCIGLSWWLLTPASDWVIDKFNKIITIK